MEFSQRGGYAFKSKSQESYAVSVEEYVMQKKIAVRASLAVSGICGNVRKENKQDEK